MEENSRKEVLEEIINNIDAVENIVLEINQNVTIPNPHNIYSYFLTGHCNIYSLILLGVFEGYATPYDNNEHIVTKIGDNYYDVEGLANWKVEDSNYRETYKDYLLDPVFTGLGEYKEGVDDKVILEGIKVGRTLLEKKIKERLEKRGEISINQ